MSTKRKKKESKQNGVSLHICGIGNSCSCPNVAAVQCADNQVDMFSKVAFSEAPTPLSKDLVTFSNLPKSRWHNLANLELIKGRNKPTQPAKKPVSAPFFLTTTAGLNPALDATGFMEEQKRLEEQIQGSRIIKSKGIFILYFDAF